MVTKIIKLSIISIVIAYFFSAFLAWDFNPGNWTPERRSLALLTLVITEIVLVVGGIDFYYDPKEEQYREL
jgi:hypothetical protein